MVEDEEILYLLDIFMNNNQLCRTSFFFFNDVLYMDIRVVYVGKVDIKMLGLIIHANWSLSRCISFC